ncbi:hypothetical protein CCP3SC1AL1_1420013 [Gammaproteobacteria bacterium]
MKEKWWKRQEKKDPLSMRKMAEYINKWIVAGQLDPTHLL